uniref:ACE1 transcription factor n=1 Tax=Lentinus brumalis TaxID=2498619 RepID=K4PZ59_9APHY|nr:ACE1 transcription factor [Polyporus brumalis]
MVYVADKKYACETCIKGHRSSTCKHTDRPLFEIKKKGRPVTQCEHCRELRKTRQIHVKCVCDSKEAGEAMPGSSSKGGTKVPVHAAFPSGLPEELLGASAAPQAPFSEGSDSDHSSPGCSCKDSATCTCWTPRARAQPAKPSVRRNSEARPASSPIGEPITHPAALVVQAHAGNNRPVLPKPPVERPASPPRTLHDPASSQSPRLPSHGQSFYSPYGRAYDYSRGAEYSGENGTSPASLQNILNDASSPTTPFGQWPGMGSGSVFSNSPITPSTCGCGPSCARPGCIEHRGPNADTAAACVNPDNCIACLDCNINSLTALAADTARTMYDPSQAQNIDDWLQQVSSLPQLPSPPMQSPGYPPSISQPDLRYDPSMMQSYGMWNDASGPVVPSGYSPTIAEECCGGRCQCPSGFCNCPTDCCGSCQGCSCSGCVHDGAAGSGRTLTFATSGERSPCCGGGGQGPPSASPTAGPSANRASLSSPSVGPSSSRFPSNQWLTPTLTVPRTPLSRASSSSSKSSGQLSAPSASPSPFGDGRDPSQRARAPDPAVSACCSSMGNLSTSSPNPTSHRRGLDHNEYRTPSFSSSSKYARPF